MTDRFDKFTERARRVLQLAQEEARRLNHNYIGTPHILLGLVREGDGVAGRVLSSFGVEVQQLRTEVGSILGAGTQPVYGEIGLSPAAKRTIELAVAEARRLNHHYIGSEHLLLGLLDLDPKDEVFGLLERLKVRPEEVRARVLEVLHSPIEHRMGIQEPAPTGFATLGKPPLNVRPKDAANKPDATASSFDKFTTRAQKVLQLAQEEAQRLNHNYIGTEHILLGLVREGDGVAARVLNDLGTELYRVRSAVEFTIGRGDHEVTGEIGLTPRAKRVIELAADEARRLSHHYIGTEHLLLGLVREGEGIAAGVLESLGVSLDKVRAQVIEVLKSSSGYSAYSGQVGPKGPKRFTRRALRVLEYAEWEARKSKHSFVGPEHIFLGLARERNSLAGKALSRSGIGLKQARQAVEAVVGTGQYLFVQFVTHTISSRDVIRHAADEAGERGSDSIGTEHLLLGLLLDQGQNMQAVLAKLNVQAEKLRQEITRMIDSGATDKSAPALDGDQPVSQETAKAPETTTSSLELLTTLFEYSIWARDRLLGVIQALDESELRKAPEAGVYGSIHDTLAHMAVSTWMWVQRCQGQSPMRMPTGEDFRDLSAIIDWWNDAHAQAVEFLSTIDEEGLSIQRTYLGPDGKKRTRKIWHMLLQLTNHQTEHRAQLGTMLGMMGKEVPQTDLVVYLSEKQA